MAGPVKDERPVGATATLAGGERGHRWSALRALHNQDEKELIATYMAAHDFMVREGSNPESDPRETVASILVNQGTTPNYVVSAALDWIRRKAAHPELFDVTWYTTGGLVLGTLRDFREENRRALEAGREPDLSNAAQVYLFPGRVDPLLEAVSGPDAVAFANSLRRKRRFTYAFFSSHSFDLTTGDVCFHYAEEMALQRACALLYAAHKFLFLDSSKFKGEGSRAYDLRDMLLNAESVTIYTVASDKDAWIHERFRTLTEKLLAPSDQNAGRDDIKSLRLCVVGRDNMQTTTFRAAGLLRDPSGRRKQRSAAVTQLARRR